MTTATITTTIANINTSTTTSNATSQTSSSSTSSFCLDCGFNFGHIVDGINDKTAGLLLVLLVVIIIGIACFLAGCTLYSKTPYKKVAQKDDVDEDENKT